MSMTFNAFDLAGKAVHHLNLKTEADLGSRGLTRLSDKLSKYLEDTAYDFQYKGNSIFEERGLAVSKKGDTFEVLFPSDWQTRAWGFALEDGLKDQLLKDFKINLPALAGPGLKADLFDVAGCLALRFTILNKD